MLLEEYETEASMLHDSQILDSSEIDVDAGAADTNDLETEPGEAFEELTGHAPATKFYTTQLDRIYESGIKCFGKDPAAIVAELEQKAEEIKAGPEYQERNVTRAQLDAIKVEEAIEPELFARAVTKEIDSAEEFRNLDQLKDFLHAKKQKLLKRHVKAVKNSEQYQSLEHELDIDATLGKQIEITCDYTGQVYLICQFNNENGANLSIHTFDIETGEVGEAIMTEQLITTVEEGDVEEEEAAQPDGTDDEMEKASDDAIENKEDLPEKKETKTVASPEKTLMQQLTKPKEVSSDYNCFNRIWTKRYDSIYFYKIKNNYHKEEQNLELMRFNLQQRTLECVRTPILKKVELEVESSVSKEIEMKTPFGINCLCFQEHSADNILQRDGFMQESMFLARQMVLVIYNNYKTASLRSVNEMMVNIVCYENKMPVTWSLYRHEKLNGSSFSPIEIGGMTKLKTYKPFLTGNLFRPNNRSWQFSKIDDTQLDLLANLTPRYKEINNLIYTKQISKAGKVHFSRQKMKDEHNLIKQSLLNLYEIDVFEGWKEENIYQQLVYLKSSFQFDTFMILQNYMGSQTYLFMSQIQQKKLRVFQLKSYVNQVVLKPWSVEVVHPITKMQYKHQENPANLVQVHPLISDILSNGEKLLSYEESSYKLSRQLRFQYKPMYLDEFLDDNEQNKYTKEYPSNILQLANDDRQYLPRLGIDESKNDDTLIYIDIHNTQSQKEIFDNECQKQIKHDITQTPSKRKLFINAWHYGWKELEVSSRFFTTSFQPSSSIELVDRERHLFKQNWQVCCLDYSQLVIQIYEYCLTWSDLPLGEDSKRDDYNLLYIGKALVLLQQPWKVYKRVNFLPYYPNKENQLIAGTQLIPEFQSTTKIHIIFENLKANDIQFKTDLCNCSYKIFQNSSRQMIGCLIKTRMCDRLVRKYSDTQKNMIFDLQQRVIANMALVRDVDIDEFVAKIVSDSQVEDKSIVEAHYKSQEMLNGQSILDFLGSSPNLHSKVETITNPNCFKLTMMGMLYDSFDAAKKKKHIDSIKATLPANFITDDNHVAVNDDLFFNNIIARCFDDLSRRSKTCKELIKHELKRPESMWIHCRMMQILPIIIKSKIGFEDYQDFFIDYDGRDDMTSFAIKLKHAQLPDFGPKNQILRKLSEPRNSNANNQKMIINTLIEENESKKVENSVPVQHFVIDFRGMLLANQIRHELKDSKVPEITNFTKYDMHYIVYRIAMKYGNKIEQFDTIRAIIDYQFLHRTKKIFQVRFINFGIFFLIPFLIQLFSENQGLGYMMNFCCLTQVIATLWHIRQYYMVEGLRKVSRKTSSLIDFALAVCYLSYLTLRIFHNFFRKENRSTLPDAENTAEPSVNLAFSIMLNLLISVLVAIKVMFALKVDEEYGLLWQLVQKCFIQMTPFSMFLGIWLLFFAVLYKILGSQNSAAADYQGIGDGLAYFFYNFQIAVNNVQKPTFSIWQTVSTYYQGQPWYYQKLLAKCMIYMIYFVWFIQQIMIPVIFMNFIIAFISGTYMSTREKKLVLLQQQKAELTRECLITTKSLGREKSIDCLVLSANTFDESLGTHWYKFVQSTKKVLRATIDGMRATMETAEADSDAYIERAKQDIRKQMKSHHEQLIKQIQSLTENANKMN